VDQLTCFSGYEGVPPERETVTRIPTEENQEGVKC